MKTEDIDEIIFMLRKYSIAIETKLYWDMSTREARVELSKIDHLVAILSVSKTLRV